MSLVEVELLVQVLLRGRRGKDFHDEVGGPAGSGLGQLGSIAIDRDIGLDHRIDLVVSLISIGQEDVEGRGVDLAGPAIR
jgi:hypothetical protein